MILTWIKSDKAENFKKITEDQCIKILITNPKTKMLSSSRRDATKTFMAKGGRVGLKSGSKGCKLAMKGKGKAYGKNS